MCRAVGARAEPTAHIFPVSYRFSKCFLSPPVMEAFLHSDAHKYRVHVHQYTYTHRLDGCSTQHQEAFNKAIGQFNQANVEVTAGDLSAI